MESHSFDGQAALVTGGSTGIGAAVALQLAKAGAKVVITGRHEATLRASAERHPGIGYVVADVARAGDVARSARRGAQAATGASTCWSTTRACWRSCRWQTPRPSTCAAPGRPTWLGLIETTRAALPLLRKSKGVIVNLATAIADQPFANMSVYCASKAAVLALTRSWAQELAPEGIRVNAVSPGPIETPMFSAEKLGIEATALEQLGSSVLGMVPLGRFGKPEEVAQVITFLASPASSYVTGAQYTVAGGLEA